MGSVLCPDDDDSSIASAQWHHHRGYAARVVQKLWSWPIACIGQGMQMEWSLGLGTKELVYGDTIVSFKQCKSTNMCGCALGIWTQCNPEHPRQWPQGRLVTVVFGLFMVSRQKHTQTQKTIMDPQMFGNWWKCICIFTAIEGGFAGTIFNIFWSLFHTLNIAVQ